MTSPLLCLLPGAGHLTHGLASHLGAPLAEVEVRHFPDGETYLRLIADPAGQDIILVDCLDRPDPKLIPLIFAAMTARDLGAKSVGLIAPYMPYFRQDIEFRHGESVSARHIGALLSSDFDWVVTLEPHLHRLSAMSDVFTIPGEAARATGPIADWIAANVEAPMLFGPDAESEQWVSAIAAACNAPYAVFPKTRLGDRSVTIDVPPGLDLKGRTPVVVDDILSSGTTVATLVKALVAAGGAAPVCIAVHGLFASGAEDLLKAAGAAQIVTTNAVAHRTNGIDISAPLAEAAKRLLAARH